MERGTMSGTVNAKSTVDRLKVVTASGWFAARRSGAESLYKFLRRDLWASPPMDALVNKARRIVVNALP